LNIGFDYVDVRDVAELHLLAMTCPEAAGERFIATTGENLTYKEEAKILRRYLGSKAKKVSTKALPDFMIKFMAIFKKDLRMPATFLGQNTACSNAKAKKLLGWQPRSAEEAIVETAKSMIELRLIDK
ncbi:nucleoside-diphosphate-sugar epimerase, partial [Clostridium beijerinckii]|nr:nucleoside-diphosphate-sugar epimerase [Clostridium beijerinckii]